MEITQETTQALSGAIKFAEGIAVEISTQEQYDGAAALLKDVKGRIKELEGMRLAITRPLDDSKKRTMELFRVPIEKLESAESKLKSGILTYSRRIEDERRLAETKAIEERRKLEAAALKAAEAGKATLAVKKMTAAEAVKIEAPEFTKAAGTSMRKVYKYRVIDEAKVPRNFLMINDSALGAYARAEKENAKVDGVEFYFEEILTSR